jgi:hypothetical protein
MGFFGAWRKGSKLHNISKPLDERGPRRQAALEELLDFVQNQEWVDDVFAKYGLSRERLRAMFQDLVAGGCGQWVRGHYVAASALATPRTLIYLCEAERRGVARSERFFQVTEYFDKGKVDAPPLPPPRQNAGR